MSTPTHVSLFRRGLAVAVAGVTFGLTGAAALAANDRPPTACRATESDLMRAAVSARRLEADRPDLFQTSPKRAGYADLRLAAEWARRLEALDPQLDC